MVGYKSEHLLGLTKQRRERVVEGQKCTLKNCINCMVDGCMGGTGRLDVNLWDRSLMKIDEGWEYVTTTPERWR